MSKKNEVAVTETKELEVTQEFVAPEFEVEGSPSKLKYEWFVIFTTVVLSVVA